MDELFIFSLDLSRARTAQEIYDGEVLEILEIGCKSYEL
jgi:hypothetical protein